MEIKYNEDSIQSLGILGGVRAKPVSIGLENHNHTFIEILANAIDEHREGYGNLIEVFKHLDGSVTVKDYGRSVPMDKNSEGEYSYKKVFDELWSGGKYKNNEEDGDYQRSLGTNGCGSCGTNYTSDFFEVWAVSPNGYKYYVKYEKGIQQCDLVKEKHYLEYTGTTIHWIPSEEVFRGKSEIDDEFIHQTLHHQAIVNKGLKFIFTNEKVNKINEYYYENGIIDYINEIGDGKNFIEPIQLETEAKGRDNDKDNDYRIGIELTFAFNNEHNHIQHFHNSSWLEDGGTPDDYIKTAFVFAIDKLIKSNNKYNKNEKKITFEDVKDSLILVSNSFSTISLFTGQSKKKVDSDFMKRYGTDWLKEQLEVYFLENPLDSNKIMEQVLVNFRARQKAETSKLNIKKKLQSNINSISDKINGFYNSKSKDKNVNILTICEGKSALAAMLSGRQDIHGVFPIRGKILNCLKAPLDRVLENEVVTNMMKVLGCGVEVGKDKKNFNIDNLNFSKVMIYVDSDYDGIGSILPLLLTVFWKLTPTLVKQGRIYICETPRYEIAVNDKYYYAIDDYELEQVQEQLKGKKYTVHYVKGLAELSSEAMAMCLSPDYKNVTQITLDNIEESIETLELFMGSEIKPRKDLILDSFN